MGKRHLADLRAWCGLITAQLIYALASSWSVR